MEDLKRITNVGFIKEKGFPTGTVIRIQGYGDDLSDDDLHKFDELLIKLQERTGDLNRGLIAALEVYLKKQ